MITLVSEVNEDSEVKIRERVAQIIDPLKTSGISGEMGMDIFENLTGVGASMAAAKVVKLVRASNSAKVLSKLGINSININNSMVKDMLNNFISNFPFPFTNAMWIFL